MGHSPWSLVLVVPLRFSLLRVMKSLKLVIRYALLIELDPFILSGHLDKLALPLTEIFNSSFLLLGLYHNP